MLYILCLLIGYAMGNIHPSILISRGVVKQDIRGVGSGNAGAANMLRNFGVWLGILTFTLDAIKGALAFLIGFWICRAFGVGLWGGAIAGIGVVLGHDWPAVYKFKGGKGIACSAGIMLVAKPDLALVILVSGLTVILLTRYFSAGSLTGVVMFFMFALLEMAWPMKVMAFVLLALAYIRHADNLKRLASNTETKVSFKNHRV